MRGKLTISISVFVMVAALAVTVTAEEIEFLRASTTGGEVWSTTGARIKTKLGKLIVSERNKKGKDGSILLARNLPYFRKAVVRLDVKQVISGTYTLQLLALHKGGHMATFDLVSDSKDLGMTEFWLEDVGLPMNTDEVLLKLWVTGAEGASTKLNDLTYSVVLQEDGYLADDRLASASPWKTEQLNLQVDDGGGHVRLPPGVAGGAILYNKRFERRKFGSLVLDVPVVENGYVTAQIVAFDHRGEYVDSADALRNVGPGKHTIHAEQISWPFGTEEFMIKIWLSGQATASATVKRMLITTCDDTIAPQPERTLANGN